MSRLIVSTGVLAAVLRTLGAVGVVMLASMSSKLAGSSSLDSPLGKSDPVEPDWVCPVISTITMLAP